LNPTTAVNSIALPLLSSHAISARFAGATIGPTTSLLVVLGRVHTDKALPLQTLGRVLDGTSSRTSLLRVCFSKRFERAQSQLIGDMGQPRPVTEK
jgi:hypothetical protein